MLRQFTAVCSSEQGLVQWGISIIKFITSDNIRVRFLPNHLPNHQWDQLILQPIRISSLQSLALWILSKSVYILRYQCRGLQMLRNRFIGFCNEPEVKRIADDIPKPA